MARAPARDTRPLGGVGPNATARSAWRARALRLGWGGVAALLNRSAAYVSMPLVLGIRFRDSNTWTLAAFACEGAVRLRVSRYASRQEARYSAKCKTWTALAPRLCTPRRICRVQPGLAVTTTSGATDRQLSILRSSTRIDMS
jgi:hypothetical protein